MAVRKLYRKRPKFNVTAVQLELDLEKFEYQKWGGKQTCKPGDWLVNNDGDIYTVDKQYFKDHYRRVSQGVFEKVGEIWAEIADADGAIKTIEGSTAYRAGDYLVFDRETGGEGYAIGRLKFERWYEEVDAEFKLSVEQKAYIDERLKMIIVDYKKKAKYNQKNFFLWQSIAIVSAALVPVFSGFIDEDGTALKWLVAILGGTSAVVAGLLSLFNYQENWIRYRNSYLDLESNISQFLVGAGIYYDRKSAFTLLVENCESILSAERGQWMEKYRQGEQQEEE